MKSSKTVSTFFFPEPPEEETPKESFRTLPREEIEFWIRDCFILYEAKAKQENLKELFEASILPKNRFGWMLP